MRIERLIIMEFAGGWFATWLMAAVETMWSCV